MASLRNAARTTPRTPGPAAARAVGGAGAGPTAAAHVSGIWGSSSIGAAAAGAVHSATSARQRTRTFTTTDNTGTGAKDRGRYGSIRTPGFRMAAGSTAAFAARRAAANGSGRWRSYQGRWSRPTAWWWVI